MKRASANEFCCLWNRGNAMRRYHLRIQLQYYAGNREAEPCEMFLLTLCTPLLVPIPINIHTTQLQLLIINTFQIKYNYKPWSMMEL